MKKLKTIALWVISVMLILLGIIFIPSTVISGLLFVLSGVICNPLILKKAQLKKRLSIPLFFFFFILGFGLFPTSVVSTADTVALQTETSSMLVETEETVIESAIESETIARESEAVVHETETVGNLEVHFLDVGQGLQYLSNLMVTICFMTAETAANHLLLYPT